MGIDVPLVQNYLRASSISSRDPNLERTMDERLKARSESLRHRRYPDLGAVSNRTLGETKELSESDERRQLFTER